MDDMSRRETLKLASALGAVALGASVALGAQEKRPDETREKKGKLRMIVLGDVKIAHGHTAPGEGWQPYGTDGAAFYIDVDTSEAKFKSLPTYITSIGGEGCHWLVSGVSAIYPRLDKDEKPLPLESGFRVYIKYPPQDLDEYRKKWYLNWVAFGE
jgi:hypothetical protein